jgi:hypothetical protein
VQTIAPSKSIEFLGPVRGRRVRSWVLSAA